MASQGPLSPTATSQSGSGAGWSDAYAVQASENSYANSSPFTGDTSYLEVTGFGFSIPGGAAISGIVVEVERRTSDAVSDMVDRSARIIKGGVISGAERATNTQIPNVDTYQSFGGSTDVWGETWTAAQINASNFGFAYKAGLGADGVLVDHIRITVYYTTAPANVNPAVISGTAQVGQTLSLTDGAGAEDWTDETSIAQQWQRADNLAFTTNPIDISGATATTYTLQPADLGKYMRCRVRATNASGSTDSNSNILGAVTGVGRRADVTATATVTAAGSGPDYSLRPYIFLPLPIDFSLRLRSFTIRRGRNSPLEPMEAGTAKVLLKDPNGELDPSNIDSPYYPRVRVLTELQLARRAASVIYNRMIARIERIIPGWLPPYYQEAEVQAADAFQALAALTLKSGKATLTTTLTGSNNDLLFTAVEAGGRGDDITVAYVLAGTNTPLAGDMNEPVAGGYRWEVDGRSVITALESTPWWMKGSSIPSPTFEVRGTDITITLATDASGNSVTTAAQVKAVVDADPDMAALVTVENAPGNSGAGVVTAMPRQNLSGGKWPQEKSGARINRALDVVGWPTSLRRIDSGLCDVVPHGFGPNDRVSVLSHIRDVARSELGYVFISADGYIVYHDGGHRGREPRSTTSQATFADVNAGAGYFYRRIQPEYSKDLIYNRVSVTPGYTGAEPKVVEDVASQLLYSPAPGVPVPRDLSWQTLLAFDTDALAVAQALLAAFKDAKVRFEEIELVERSNVPGWTEAVYGRELGDLVTVRTKPPGHDTVGVYDCYVEGITDEGRPGEPVRTTFTLSLASETLDVPVPGGPLRDSSGDDFVLDSSTAGVLG